MKTVARRRIRSLGSIPQRVEKFAWCDESTFDKEHEDGILHIGRAREEL
jgi:hypothetical protein